MIDAGKEVRTLKAKYGTAWLATRCPFNPSVSLPSKRFSSIKISNPVSMVQADALLKRKKPPILMLPKSSAAKK
jgi:hypothetical protein